MLRTQMIWTAGGGVPYYGDLYYGGTTEGEATAAHAATANLSDAFEPHTVSNMIWHVSSDVDVVDPVTGQTTAQFNVPQTDHQGTVNNDPVPWAVMALFRWRTGVFVNGREIRGRTYWPGIPEVTTVQGILPTTVTNPFNALLAAHLVDPDTVAANGRVVWSRANGQAAEVLSANTWQQLAIMRSRRPE